MFFQSITSEPPPFFVPKANQPANSDEPVPNGSWQNVTGFIGISR
jgi:hypothetical protein